MTFKLEVGKTYVDDGGFKVRIVCVDRASPISPGPPIVGLRLNDNMVEVVEFYTAAGHGLYGRNLVKEYKEPVIHRRKVFWYTAPDSPHVRCVGPFDTTMEWGTLSPLDEDYTGLRLAKEQIIEYTEGE
jgi:hypothetical protein